MSAAIAPQAGSKSHLSVNNVEVIPCRVEGHVTGFQAIAGGVARPYEAPFDGKIVAWSITLSKPSRTDTKTTTDEVGFFDGRHLAIALGNQRPDDFFGVMHVHLTAESLEVKRLLRSRTHSRQV